MTTAQAFQNVLNRSEIQIAVDKAGRQFAQYYSRAARRWIRVSMAAAELALAHQAEA